MAGSKANATSFGASKGNQPGRKKGDPTNTGSDPETFKARMRLIASREKTVKNVEKILDDSDHPQFSKMFETAANRGYGKPVPAEAVRERVAKTLAVIREQCPGPLADAILAELRVIWA